MINATGLELRAGSRILLAEANLRVQPGDRIGLVGRNGAGKTTTLKVLAGEGQPARRLGRAPRARSATCRRTRVPVTCPSPPATGCSPPAAWTRCWPR
jgi:ATPase subunit of ABC transporter with duplicated ATPase domains